MQGLMNSGFATLLFVLLLCLAVAQAAKVPGFPKEIVSHHDVSTKSPWHAYPTYSGSVFEWQSTALKRYRTNARMHDYKKLGTLEVDFVELYDSHYVYVLKTLLTGEHQCQYKPMPGPFYPMQLPTINMTLIPGTHYVNQSIPCVDWELLEWFSGYGQVPDVYVTTECYIRMQPGWGADMGAPVQYSSTSTAVSITQIQNFDQFKARSPPVSTWSVPKPEDCQYAADEDWGPLYKDLGLHRLEIALRDL